MGTDSRAKVLVSHPQFREPTGVKTELDAITAGGGEGGARGHGAKRTRGEGRRGENHVMDGRQQPIVYVLSSPSQLTPALLGPGGPPIKKK